MLATAVCVVITLFITPGNGQGELAYTVPNNPCWTSSGPLVNQACQFPFKYNGKWHNRCIKKKDGQAWCSTRVDYQRKHIKGRWGNCNCNNNCGCPPGSAWSNNNIYNNNIPANPTSLLPYTIPSNPCWTYTGPKVSQACQFPFRWNGRTWNSCAPWSDGRAWCSTRVDSSKRHVLGNWGHCNCSNNCGCTHGALSNYNYNTNVDPR